MQVGGGHVLRGTLHCELVQALRRSGQPRTTHLRDRARLQQVQAKVALVVDERAHEWRHDECSRARLLLGRELRRDLKLQGRHCLPLRRRRIAGERAPAEEEDGPTVRGQAILTERALLFELHAVEQ